MAKYICYDKNNDLLTRIYQWDTDRVIVVSNITPWDGATVFFQFGNRKVDETIIVEPTESNGNYTSDIPNELLAYAENLILYISQETAAGETLVIDEIRIPIVPKNMPSNYIYQPNTEDIVVANGLITDGEVLYLARNGRRIGTGVIISGGGSGGGFVTGSSAVALTGTDACENGIATGQEL